MTTYTARDEEGKSRPIEREALPDAGFQELVEKGVILPAEGPRQKLVPAGKRPGALARFLESRR